MRLLLVLATVGCAGNRPVSPPTTSVDGRMTMTIDFRRLQRTHGDDVVIANDDVMRSMRAFNRDRLVTRYEICLDVHGNVRTLRREKLSGIEEYDLQTALAIRTWRFEPFVVDGVATAVCTHARLDFVAP